MAERFSTISDDLGSYPVHMTAWEKVFLGWLNYELAFAGEHSSHKISALEINTKRAPLSLSRYAQIVGWWRAEGGRVITFGSDAHDPTGIAHGFAEAAAMVEAHGFRVGRHPYDVWTR